MDMNVVSAVVEDKDEEARLILRKVMSLTWKVIIWSASYFKFCFVMVMLVVFFRDDNDNNSSSKSGSESDDHIGIVGAIVAGILCYLGMFVIWIIIIYVDLVKRLESFLMIRNYYIQQQQQQDQEEGASPTTSAVQVTQLWEHLGGPFVYLPIISLLGFLVFTAALTRSRKDGHQIQQPDHDGVDVPNSTNSITFLMIGYVLIGMLSGHMWCFLFQIYRDLKVFAQRRYEAATTTARELQERPATHRQFVNGQVADKRLISCPQILETGAYSSNSTAAAYVPSSSLPPCRRCSANEWRLIEEENKKFSHDYRHWEIERMKLGEMIHDAILINQIN